MPKLETELDKMGPRWWHCANQFLMHSYMQEYSTRAEIPAIKPTLQVKTYLLMKNILGQLDFAKFKSRFNTKLTYFLDTHISKSDET